MAEGGASGRVPEIELRWFNLKSGRVETATVDGFDISVEGPPASGPARERSMLALAAAGLAILVALATLTFLVRRFWPRAVDAHRRRQARRRASKAWAKRAMRSETPTSELQSLMRISYAVFCFKNKTTQQT